MTRTTHGECSFCFLDSVQKLFFSPNHLFFERCEGRVDGRVSNMVFCFVVQPQNTLIIEIIGFGLRGQTLSRTIICSCVWCLCVFLFNAQDRTPSFRSTTTTTTRYCLVVADDLERDERNKWLLEREPLCEKRREANDHMVPTTTVVFAPTHIYGAPSLPSLLHNRTST